jgi:hypothetical protein
MRWDGDDSARSPSGLAADWSQGASRSLFIGTKKICRDPAQELKTIAMNSPNVSTFFL